MKEKTMPAKEKIQTKSTTEAFTDLFKTFSDAIGKILDDPEVRGKAREFSDSVIDAAARVMENKVKKEEVRAKIREVGKAAQTFGKSVEQQFKVQSE
jgi:[ribosomal protein S5]-alanine N-acetyltransferase